MTGIQTQPLSKLAIIAILIWALGSTGIATAVTAPTAEPSEPSQDDEEPTRLDSCTTIEESGHYVLTADITNTTADTCVQIRADNVVLDGQGHTIDGVQNQSSLHDYVNATLGVEIAPNGTTIASNETAETLNDTENQTDAPPSVPQNTGIAANTTGTLSNVTVTNIQVSDLLIGVHYDNVTDGTIRNMIVETNGDGVIVTNGSEVTVADTQLIENMWGTFAWNGSNGTLQNITATNNRITGIDLSGSRAMTVTESTVSDSGFLGIIFGGTNESRVTDSTVTGTGYLGISFFSAHRNTVVNTTIANTTGAVTPPFIESAALGLNDSRDNRMQDVTTVETANWTYYAANNSANNTVENLLVDRTLRVSFTGQDIALAHGEPRTDREATQQLTSGRVTLQHTGPNASVTDLRIKWQLAGEQGHEEREVAGVQNLIFEVPVIGTVGPPTDPDGDGLYDDVTGDGQVNAEDPVALAFLNVANQQPEFQLTPEQATAFDFTDDGKFTYEDVIELASKIGPIGAS